MHALSVQIGSYRLRKDGRFLQSIPIYKTLSLKVAESFADMVATLLVDCYNENESRIILLTNCVALSHNIAPRERLPAALAAASVRGVSITK